MDKILRTYEAVLLCVIYIIISSYSVSAMLKLINESDSVYSLFSAILIDILWLILIVVLGALLVSASFNYRNKKK